MLTRRDLLIALSAVTGLVVGCKESMAKKLNIGAVARWVGTPILNFVNGTPDSVDLSQWVHNPRGFNLTYTVASGSLGEVTLVGSVVSFDGSGPQSSTPVSFNISDGSRTKESPQTFVTIVNEPVMDPAVPVNVQATGLTQDTIRITWDPGAGGPTPTSFPVYRSDTLNGTYTEIAAPAASPYDDCCFPPNTTRWYKVSARIDGTESAQSTADAGTTQDIVVEDEWPTQGAIATVPALRNRRGFAINTNRHAFTGLAAGVGPTLIRVGTSTSQATNNAQLKTALEASGNRIIVFERSGTYTISNLQDIGSGNLWVCGQTAPAPGVTLRATRLRLTGAQNVLIQHVRLHLTEDFGPSVSADCVFIGGPGNATGIVLDHVDCAFSYDELLDLLGNSSCDLDLMECGFMHPLDCNAIRGDGIPFAMGPRLSSNNDAAVTRVSFQGCMIAHIRGRGPHCSVTQLLIANGLHYNWLNRMNDIFNFSGTDVLMTNIIGNRYKHGSASTQKPIDIRPEYTDVTASRVHISGNSLNGNTPADQYSTAVLQRTAIPDDERRSANPIASALPAGWVGWTNGAAMESYVLANFGARPSNRNALNNAVRNNYVNGTGQIILVADTNTGGCTTAGSPGSDVSLTINHQPFTEDADPWGNMTDPVDGKTRRKIEVQLLNMSDALRGVP